MEKKQIYTAGLVLGILSIPCGLIFAMSGWILGIVGIVQNVKNRTIKNTTAGLVLSIVGLVVSAINSLLGFLVAVSMW